MRITVKPKFDEKKWKPIIVGVIVFIVVFAGLTAYQKSVTENRGDKIVREGIPESNEELPESNEGILESNEGIPESDDGNAADSDEDTSIASATIFVDVGGAVDISGLFALPAGSRIADAIEAAGGLTEEADIKYINRAYVLEDGDRLYIPTVSETLSGTAPPSAGQVSAGAGTGTNTGTSSGSSRNDESSALININTAGSDELQKLNGVGPATAQKIIDHRNKRGEFKRVEDLMNVSGIGVKTFEKMRDYITV